jgi:hypothetical protein
MDRLFKQLSFPRAVFLETPVSILRGVYVHLRRRGFVARNTQKLLEMLGPEGSIQVSSFERLESMDDTVTGEWRAHVCQDLSKGLFANEGLCRTRLKLNMAMVCSVSCFVLLLNIPIDLVDYLTNGGGICEVVTCSSTPDPYCLRPSNV